MPMPNDDEHEEILRWYEERRKKMQERLKTTTDRVRVGVRSVFEDYFGVIPEEVTKGRNLADAMREMESKITKIDSATEETKFSLSALFSGLGQAVAERKAKKK